MSVRDVADSRQASDRKSEQVMTGEQWIITILLGGIAGLVGQGIRGALGMQKMRELSEASGQSAEAGFNPKMFLSSLLIGFTAGAMASFTLEFDSSGTIDMKTILVLVAAGYAGTDFIEGTAKRILPRSA